MVCPRCAKDQSNQLNFYFEERKVRLLANTCRICGYVWSEDEELLKAARKHLAILCHKPLQEKNSPKKK